MIPNPAQISRQHLANIREPAYTLIRKRCPATGCGKQTTARQLVRHGRCAACDRKGGGIAMGAFCVYGISRSICRAVATKKVPAYAPGTRRAYSMEEWNILRDALAEKLFMEGARLTKVGPELDTPRFCRDWLVIDPGNVRSAVIMVRGPKIDKHGNEVMRAGVVVETWLAYETECARLNIRADI